MMERLMLRGEQGYKQSYRAPNTPAHEEYLHEELGRAHHHEHHYPPNLDEEEIFERPHRPRRNEYLPQHQSPITTPQKHHRKRSSPKSRKWDQNRSVRQESANVESYMGQEVQPMAQRPNSHQLIDQDIARRNVKSSNNILTWGNPYDSRL